VSALRRYAQFIQGTLGRRHEPDGAAVVELSIAVREMRAEQLHADATGRVEILPLNSARSDRLVERDASDAAA